MCRRIQMKKKLLSLSRIVCENAFLVQEFENLIQLFADPQLWNLQMTQSFITFQPIYDFPSTFK